MSQRKGWFWNNSNMIKHIYKWGPRSYFSSYRKTTNSPKTLRFLRHIRRKQTWRAFILQTAGTELGCYRQSFWHRLGWSSVPESLINVWVTVTNVNTLHLDSFILMVYSIWHQRLSSIRLQKCSGRNDTEVRINTNWVQPWKTAQKMCRSTTAKTEFTRRQLNRLLAGSVHAQVTDLQNKVNVKRLMIFYICLSSAC